MKKLIFNKLYLNILRFFFSSLLAVSLIVLTLQAVNFFDFVTEDGHGLRVYFLYTIFNFPKIISRILPFIFFITIFYMIMTYKSRNELNIFWIFGVNKIEFLHKLIFLAFFIMLFQIILSSYIAPKSQLKARNILKISNIDFFSSLIKEGKFINIAKNLTIFIEKENAHNSFSNIFLEDKRSQNSKMIYAKNGKLIINQGEKKFKLFNGRIINTDNSRITIFDFEQIDFNLNNLISKTIKVPKIQERDTIVLFKCISNIKIPVEENFNCEKKLIPDIKRELFKRLYKPIFLPLLVLICSFLIIDLKKIFNIGSYIIIFVLNICILLVSEASMRYVATSTLLTIICIIIPLLLFLISYIFFYKFAKNV